METAELLLLILVLCCRIGQDNVYLMIMKKFLFSCAVFVGLFVFISPVFGQTATLYFVPSANTVSAGQTFRVTVMVNTQGQQVNAVAAYFTYPSDKVDALVSDTVGSAMTLIAEPQPGNPVGVNGKVLISGGTPTPGFSGIQKIASVNFRVKPAATGSIAFVFTSDAAVLRNSDNQNILSLPTSGTARFQIVAGSPLPPPTPPIAPPPEGTPPPPAFAELTISDIKAEKLSEGGILLSWKTSQPTKGSVHYGPSSQEDYEFSVIDGFLTTEHSLVLSEVDIQEDYSLEIIGVNEQGNQVKKENLVLAELLVEKGEPTPLLPVDEQIEIGGFEIRPSMLLLFVGLPILVVLLLVFLIFWRMRSKVGG